MVFLWFGEGNECSVPPFCAVGAEAGGAGPPGCEGLGAVEQGSVESGKRRPYVREITSPPGSRPQDPAPLHSVLTLILHAYENSYDITAAGLRGRDGPIGDAATVIR